MSMNSVKFRAFVLCESQWCPHILIKYQKFGMKFATPWIAYFLKTKSSFLIFINEGAVNMYVGFIMLHVIPMHVRCTPRTHHWSLNRGHTCLLSLSGTAYFSCRIYLLFTRVPPYHTIFSPCNVDIQFE